MFKIFMLVVTILVVPIQALALEPFFYGEWGSRPDAIKRMELRELVSIDETSIKDFTNVVVLKYKSLSGEENLIIDYYFNHNKLALVTWTENINNVDNVCAENFWDYTSKKIASGLNNPMIAEHDKILNGQNRFHAIIIKKENTAISMLFHHFVNESKLWCYISFFDINNPFNAGLLETVNNIEGTIIENQQ